MAITTRGMTMEEYQDLVYSDPDRIWELNDGRPEEKPGMSWDHLDIVTELTYLLRRQLDRAQYRVLAEGRVRRPEATVFIPDILVAPTALGAEWRGKPGTLAIFPEPLPLIVEVWSRSTGDYDVMAKLPVYRQRGDREIWLIHPYERTLTSWRRQENGSYIQEMFRSGQVEAIGLPGVTIQLEEVFEDVLSDDQVIETLHLFPGERAALLKLLESLSPAEWDAPTACPDWSVKDVAGHLLADDVGRLSRGRDGYANPDFATGLDLSSLPGLIAAIDRQNTLWVEAMRRVSPPLLIELLRLTGDETFAYFSTLDLAAVGGPVDWVGSEPAPVWLDVAREYTERWVHQQHIRDAVSRPGLKERHWFAPVLSAFVLALPRALARTDAAEGASVRLLISGEAGGIWTVRQNAGSWHLTTADDQSPDAVVELDAETAWRLFTRGIGKDEARGVARMQGDPHLGDAVLDMVSILAD